MKNNNQNKQNNNQQENQARIGSFAAIVDIVRSIFRKRDGISVKNIKREDCIAALLTLIIIVGLGIILWYIPFTRSFITSLIPY